MAEWEDAEDLKSSVTCGRAGSSPVSRIFYNMRGDFQMDMQTILQAVGTVGFPIVACAAMFWLNYKTGQQHREEMKQMTDAVNNNTQAIIKLTAELEGKQNG